MSDIDPKRLASQFFTGSSGFLVANPHFAEAMVAASGRCALHASENIYDANGLMLWAGGKPIDDRLLERLMGRKLRKPIELCVYAPDPVAAAAVRETIEQLAAAVPDLAALIGPNLGATLRTVAALVPNPTELMLLSVLRHGERDRMQHAALVAAIALAMGRVVDVHPELLPALARAALLHDLGELYLPPALFLHETAYDAEQMRQMQKHPALGAQVAVEVARSGATVAHLIAASHERHDGWGYPRGATQKDLSLPEQALLFAEAMAPLFEKGSNRLRRAAVGARLLPGEFCPEMVDRIYAVAQERPVDPDLDALPETVALDLRQLHSVLDRIVALLAAPEREARVVLAVLARWRPKVESLLRVLRAAGVAEALAGDLDVAPLEAVEAIELRAVCEELRHRVRGFRLRVEMAMGDVPDLGASGLALHLLDALAASEAELEARNAQGSVAQALPWSRIFLVGVREIDEQHRTIVDLLNRLNAARLAPPAGADVRGEVLDRLVEYVGVHFSTEERLMRENPGAESPAHRGEHLHLTERVLALMARYQAGEAPDYEELVQFLRRWLIGHILHSDKELGAALNAAGVH